MGEAGDIEEEGDDCFKQEEESEGRGGSGDKYPLTSVAHLKIIFVSGGQSQEAKNRGEGQCKGDK